MRSSCRSLAALALLVAAALAPTGCPFCGFYVAKADADLFNEASKVVFARHDDKSVITMVNDFQGALQEFALVMPVPSVLERGQIHVTDNALVDHLDAYTAPRLVEYFDQDPCRVQEEGRRMAAPAPTAECERRRGARASRRGAVYGRRVRHRDPLGRAERRAARLAAPGGLPAAGGAAPVVEGYLAAA